MPVLEPTNKKKNYTRAIDETIAKMRQEDKSIKEIAKAVERTQASVTYRINKVLKVKDYNQIKYQD